VPAAATGPGAKATPTSPAPEHGAPAALGALPQPGAPTLDAPGPVAPKPADTGVTAAPAVALGAPAPVPPSEEPAFDFPDPHPPRPAGIGSHLLGVLVGLVLAPVGAVALLLGQSRILVVQTDGWNGSVETLGIALVAVGTVLLAAIALLAGWTAAAPVTGGVVLTALGATALVAPTFAHQQLVTLIDSEGWHPTIEQTVVAMTSGTAFVAGALLLVAGLAAAAARRRGVRLGAFVERNRD
jgi:hypothetical protein